MTGLNSHRHPLATGDDADNVVHSPTWLHGELWVPWLAAFGFLYLMLICRRRCKRAHAGAGTTG